MPAPGWEFIIEENLDNSLLFLSKHLAWKGQKNSWNPFNRYKILRFNVTHAKYNENKRKKEKQGFWFFLQQLRVLVRTRALRVYRFIRGSGRIESSSTDMSKGKMELSQRPLSQDQTEPVVWPLSFEAYRQRYLLLSISYWHAFT